MNTMNLKRWLQTRQAQIITMLLVLTIWAIPQGALADDYMQTASNYTCMQMGMDKVRFTLPTQYDGTTNEGVQNGYVYISVDGGASVTLFEWKCNKYSELDQGYWIKAYQGGSFQLVGKAKSWTSFTSSSDWVKYYLNNDDDNKDHRTTTVDWVIPREMRGKNLKLYMWAHVNWSAAGDWHIPSASTRRLMLDWDAPESAATGAELSDFMLAYDQKQVGKIMTVYSINAKSVTSAKLYYTDAVTNVRGSMALENKLVSFAYLPMDRPYTNVYIEASVVDTEGYPVNVKSAPIKASMVHVPKNFRVSLTPEGHAVLNWTVDDPIQEDMDEYDAFEIQRNVSGGESVSGWQMCTTVNYEKGVGSYTYEDESLLEVFKGNPVAYRIRRLSAGIWSWSDGSGNAECTLNTLPVLPRIANATVQRTDTWNDESHVAQVSFDFSPLASTDNNMILRDVADWEAFAARVNAGEKSLCATMVKDIDISSSKAMVGNTETNRYEGTFNGNGCTLTVNYNTTEGYTAPFRHTAGATIKDLVVDGKLTSSQKFTGGIIGRCVSGTNAIVRCRVKATINSSVNGDATNGGFVALNSSGTLNINGCKFEGSFTGANCHSNGGFVGFNDGTTNINNSLFAPVLLHTGYTSCQSFARSRSQDTYHLTNCRYITPYVDKTTKIDNKDYYLLRDSDDWAVFVEAVKTAQGKTDVNAIMVSNFTITKNCGDEGFPFRGTFDGNGHTLNVNITGTGYYEAPFKYAKGCTFKNLRVTGKVRGDNHASGLVGCIDGNPNVTMERVRVSADIVSTADHVGGFVGHAMDVIINVSDCVFDGSLTATGTSYGGAILGWGHNGSWTLHRVYECGGYYNIVHASLGYWYDKAGDGAIHNWGQNSKSTNCISSLDWGEIAEGLRNMYDPNQVIAKMNAEKAGTWQVVNGQAIPVTATQSFGQGTSAVNTPPAELLAALGNEWTREADEVVPLASSSRAIWDKRAKLQLRMKMHGEKDVDTRIIDLTGNDDALKKQTIAQELSRQCVEYSFDLLVARGTSPLKFVDTNVDSLIVPIVKIDKGDLQVYRFLNSDTIKSITPVTKQSSVELTWKTSGGDHDFFRILRKDKIDQQAKWDTIATDLKALYYEDNTVLAQHTYRYRVESVYQCEGTTVSGIEAEGKCEETGMVNGYVRLADGTAMSGVVVRITPDDDVTKEAATQDYWEVRTDSTGYYEAKGLPYRENGKYSIFVPSGDGPSFTGSGTITFSPSSNWTKNFNLYQDEYVIYSGNVYYRDTSIPVPGVSFKLDGAPMYDANQQLIETDTQGGFELSIPKGDHSVQAFKEGHYFANRGFLINHDALIDSTRYNFTKNVASVYLWDSTTVVLRGRVVGGDIQGSKPLGQSLSKNNLGDSLKIIMQLEGDNTSWLIRKQNDETVKSADYSVAFGKEKGDTTHVSVTRHTLTIRPDAKTGEYEVALHPAKYKVIEVSAQGYPTLFQQGKVGETIDLTFNHKGDTCVYNRIYHAMPDLEVRQLNGGSEDYFGFKQYTATNNIGDSEVVNVWYKDEDGVGHYSFGYPVFMAQSPYAWILQACEKYYKNNNVAGEVDIVNLNSGKVKFKNALTTDAKTSECEVHSTRQALDSMYSHPITRPSCWMTIWL